MGWVDLRFRQITHQLGSNYVIPIDSGKPDRSELVLAEMVNPPRPVGHPFLESGLSVELKSREIAKKYYENY
jgi:hypothetical protein